MSDAEAQLREWQESKQFLKEFYLALNCEQGLLTREEKST